MRNRDLILRIIAVVLLLYSFTSFFAGFKELKETEQLVHETESALETLREENSRLREALSSPPDDEEMGKLARQRLGMVKPGEKVFIFTDREEPKWGRK